MGATVGSTVVSPITWAGATFAWNSIDAHKPWDNFNILDWTLDADDSVTVAEAAAKAVSKGFTEGVTVGESFAKSFVKNLLDETTFAETLTHQALFHVSTTEGISLDDGIAKSLIKAAVEAISAADALDYMRSIDFVEAGTVGEAFTRAWTAIRSFSESTSVGETVAKHVSKEVIEALTVIEILLRKSNAVLSDLLITVGDMTPTEFLDALRNSSAPAFDDFRRFLDGDYQYQDAIFREVLRTSSADLPRITTLVTRVDVPDVFDRGRADVPAANTFIPFNRSFTSTQELEVNFRFTDAADDARGRITSITKDGFYFECRDNSNLVFALSTLLTSGISWFAHGY